MDDLMQIDLYALIGTVAEASTKEIKTAYRKKALSCHPDKNPDNPRAAELFHQLSRALEILTDDSARAAYDKVLKARRQAKLRASEYDAKRKKLKDDLEAREEAYRQSQNSYSTKSDEQKLKAEIERLQKEGSKQVEEEVAFVRQQIYEQLYGAKSKKKNFGSGSTRIKIKWKCARDDPDNGGYDYDTLHRILSKHGDIAVLVVSSTKKGSALVEYRDSDSAELAAKIEIGLATNPLTLQGLWESEKHSTKTRTNLPTNLSHGPGLFPAMNPGQGSAGTAFPGSVSAPNIFATQTKISEAEFENTVLQNMRRAEERKRLIEKLEAEQTT